MMVQFSAFGGWWRRCFRTFNAKMISAERCMARASGTLEPYQSSSCTLTAWHANAACTSSACFWSVIPAYSRTSSNRGPFHRQFITAASPQSMPSTSFNCVRMVCLRFPAHCKAATMVACSNLVSRSDMESVRGVVMPTPEIWSVWFSVER